MESLTLSHGVELCYRGITVDAVAPGSTETDMLNRRISAEMRRLTAATCPLGRLGRPEDIAEVVAFLCSDAAAWITGQVIGIDGGQLAGAPSLFRIASIARALKTVETT